MNSKQVVAAASAVILIILLAYPALSTGTVTVRLSAEKIANADHVFVTVGNVWIHHSGYSQSDGWEVVTNETQTVDLVNLTNTPLSFSSGQLPVGGYDTVRMQLTNVTWVYNKTTTKLSVQSTQLQTSLQFTLQSGRGTSILMMISGHQEQIQGSEVFVCSIYATLTGPGQ